MPARVLVAPAMNVRMWEHPATQANVGVLRARGVEFVGPAEGELAEGEVGRGADGGAGGDRGQASTELLRARLRVRLSAAAASSSRLAERASLSTRVRFVGNRSSGRMGVALAEEARRARRGRHAARREPRRPRTGRCHGRRDADGADLEREALARAGCGRDRDGCGRRRLPAADALDSQAAEGRRDLDGGARADARRPRCARRAGRPRAGARRLRGGRGRAGPRARAGRSGATRTPICSCSTTSAGTDIGFDVADNEVRALGERGAPCREGPEARDRRGGAGRGGAATLDDR